MLYRVIFVLCHKSCAGGVHNLAGVQLCNCSTSCHEFLLLVSFARYFSWKSLVHICTLDNHYHLSSECVDTGVCTRL